MPADATSHTPVRASVILPFATWGACAPSADAPRLPALEHLLQGLRPDAPDRGEANSLSPPHERALARALGLSDALDGTCPWAAQAAARVGVPCAWFTPCHWSVGMEDVTLHDPATLALAEDESRALLQALAPFAAEDGITLVPERAGRWRAEGEPLRGMACASLDRVVGQVLDPWMPDAAQARLLRRLQNEAQMLFYTHPVNEARATRGLPAVNSFWISGAGVWDGRGLPLGDVEVWDALRAPALQGDVDAWLRAWQTLDEGPMQALLRRVQAGETVSLTLCGQLHAQTWRTPVAPPTLIARALQALRRPTPAATVLATL